MLERNFETIKDNSENQILSATQGNAAEITPVASSETVRQLALEKMQEESVKLDRKTEMQLLDSERTLLRENGFRKESKTYKGVNIEMCGVWHVPELLLDRRKAIEESIEHCDAVVLEGAPMTRGDYQEEFFQKIHEVLYRKDPNQFPLSNYVSKSLDENPFDSFFHEVEKIAWKNNKPIILLDPFQNPQRFLEDQAFDALHNKESIRLLDEAMRQGLTDAGEIMALWLGYHFSFGDHLQEEMSDMRRKVSAGMTRREFLKKTGIVVSATMIGQMAASPLARFLTRNNPNGNPATYNAVLDYRNVMIAKGIDLLAQSRKTQHRLHPSQEGQPRLTFIYGINHIDGVARYLSNSLLRETKEIFYYPYNQFMGDLDIIEYKTNCIVDAHSERGYTAQSEERLVVPLYRKS